MAGKRSNGRSPNTAWSVRPPEVPGDELRVGRQVAAVLHLAGRHAVGLQRRGGAALGGSDAHHSRNRASISARGRSGRPPWPARIAREVGDVPADGLAQPPPVVVVAAGDGHLALVAAAVHLVRAPLAERIGVADRVGLAAVGEVVEQRRTRSGTCPSPSGRCRCAGPRRCAAGASSAASTAHGRGQAGGVVVEREARPDVAAIRRVRQVGQAAQRVDRRGVGDHVRPRPLVAGAAHRHVDDVRVPRP